MPSCFTQTWSRPSCQDSQWNHRGVSTLPRTKPKSYGSPSLPAKPRISIFPVQKPNSSPTHTAPKPKPLHSLHLPDSDFTDPSPLLHHPVPQPAAASTLTVPARGLSLSPTSFCHEITVEGPGFQQPPAIAKGRSVRSISISNTRSDSSVSCSAISKKHFEQGTAKSGLRIVEPVKLKESPRQPHSDCQRQASETSLSPEGKNTSIKCEKKDGDKARLPLRNTDISAILGAGLNNKQQQEPLPSGGTGKQTFLSKSGGIMFPQRKSLQPFDKLPIRSGLNLHSKRRGDSRDRMGGLGSDEQSFGPACAERSAAAPPRQQIPAVSFSKESSQNHSAVVHNTDTRRRQHSLDSGAKVASHREGPLGETTPDTPSEASPHQIAAPQKPRFCGRAPGAHPQMDRAGAPSASEDYNRHSGEDDEGRVHSHFTHRLNKLNTCLVAPHTWRPDWPTAPKWAAEAAEQPSPGVRHHGPYGGHTGPSCCHAVLNRTPLASSRQSSDSPLQPQQRPAEPPVEAWPAAGRAFITEEDPYYVTMYCPGSVYVGK